MALNPPPGVNEAFTNTHATFLGNLSAVLPPTDPGYLVVTANVGAIVFTVASDTFFSCGLSAIIPDVTTFTVKLNTRVIGPGTGSQPGDGTDLFTVFLPAGNYNSPGMTVVDSQVAAGAFSSSDNNIGFAIQSFSGTATTPTMTSIAVNWTSNLGTVPNSTIPWIYPGAQATTLTLNYRVHNVGSYTSITGLTGTSRTITGLTPGTVYDLELFFVEPGSSSASVQGVFQATTLSGSSASRAFAQVLG